ncbi:hypothetical protein [Halorussus ruber]|uniref:hypothetical protein n=1 Tax=Halorussus ruber TaxID=1126238 RepID=UPI0010926564|nr:hypothetical protein [Halorussus ruber]
MTDRAFWKGSTLRFAGLGTLALAVGVVGGVVAFGVLDVTRTPPPIDDLLVSNEDDANRTVRVAVFPANGSGESAAFEANVTLTPDERRSFAETTERDETYRLLVAVDGREPESFEIVGPDRRCATIVQVESNATADVWRGCT